MLNLIAAFCLFSLGLGGFIFLSLMQKRLYEKHTLLGLFAKSPTWAVLLTDKEGKVQFVNKAFENIFTLRRKSIYEMIFDDVLPHLHVKKNLSFQEIKNNAPSIVSYTIAKENKSYRVLITPLLKHGEEFEGSIITVNDITHEKELELKELEHEQILIQNSKMAALGEMVSAISHQWRQPLGTLLMLISNAEENIENLNATPIQKTSAIL
jgi:PAS domain S-box-containing protein